MKKKFKNYECELSGSLITIKDNGMVLKAYDVNPIDAIESFNKVCSTIEVVASKVK